MCLLGLAYISKDASCCHLHSYKSTTASLHFGTCLQAVYLLEVQSQELHHVMTCPTGNYIYDCAVSMTGDLILLITRGKTSLSV